MRSLGRPSSGPSELSTRGICLRKVHTRRLLPHQPGRLQSRLSSSLLLELCCGGILILENYTYMISLVCSCREAQIAFGAICLVIYLRKPLILLVYCNTFFFPSMLHELSGDFDLQQMSLHVIMKSGAFVFFLYMKLLSFFILETGHRSVLSSFIAEIS